MKHVFAAAAVLALAACGQQETAPDPAEDAAVTPSDGSAAAQDPAEEAAATEPGAEPAAESKLDVVLAHERRDEDRARDEHRHPEETLEFFGLEPDMAVGEVLPGGGWYTRILLPYVTPEGSYVALDYPLELIRAMRGDEAAEARADWPEEQVAALQEWAPEGAEISAYAFGQIPDDMNGQLDAVLFVRSLHHLNRIDVAHLDQAVSDAFAMLRPGGVVGVVQHRARPDASDEYASGDKGYLRESDVVAAFERGGFQLEARSEVNANPLDTADYEAGVWTLPPSGRGGEEYAEIGESDRMTLKFVKPE